MGELEREAKPHEKKVNSKWIILTLILATTLRIIRINRSFYSDELICLFMSANPADIVWRFTFLFDCHPATFTYLLHFWQLVSHNPAYLRIFSLIPAIATVYVVYLIGKKMFDERAGLLAAFLIAINPLHIQISTQPRNYSFMTLFLCLAFYFMLERKWIKYALFGALSPSTMYLAIFPIAAIGIYSVVKEKFSKKVLLANSLMVAIISLNLITIIPQKVHVIPIISHTSPFWVFFIIPYIIVACLIGSESPYFYARQIILSPALIGLFFSLLFFGFLFYRFIKQRQKFVDVIFLALCPLAINLAVEPLLHMPLDPRRVMFSAVLIHLGIAKGLSTFGKKALYGFIIILLLISSVSLVNFYTYDYIDWKGAAEHVRQNEKPGDVIIVVEDGLDLPIKFYYGGNLEVKDFPYGIYWLSGNLSGQSDRQWKNMAVLENLTQGNNRVWLFVWVRQAKPFVKGDNLWENVVNFFKVRRYELPTIYQQTVIDYFEERYNLVEVYSSKQKTFPSEGILKVYLFEQKNP